MTDADANHRRIVRHYEECFRAHGDNHRGADWPNAHDAALRYDVMLGILPAALQSPRSERVSVLDFGCGAGQLLAHIQAAGATHIDYTGLDASEKLISFARQKYSEASFHCVDVFEQEHDIGQFDFVILNGVLTEKRDIPYSDMFTHMQRLLSNAFSFCSRGMAFNVMSKQVDWEREDLFHVPFDDLASWMTKSLTRHFQIRHDYGLYEYTVYAQRKPWQK
jgi:SAM-dependent methyltransferase